MFRLHPLRAAISEADCFCVSERNGMKEEGSNVVLGAITNHVREFYFGGILHHVSVSKSPYIPL